jgi:hypothetical protein
MTKDSLVIILAPDQLSSSRLLVLSSSRLLVFLFSRRRTGTGALRVLPEERSYRSIAVLVLVLVLVLSLVD